LEEKPKTIVFKSGSIQQVDLGLKSGRVEKKQEKKKVVWPRWPNDLVDPTRSSQKPGYNPLTFIFLLKQRQFDFFKKIDQVTRSKPETRVLDRIESKNYI
jgi:hypothetical protein